jgi:hypothetical protein
MNQNKPNESPLRELEHIRRQYAELKSAIEKSAFPASLSKFSEGIIVDVNEAFEREFGITKQGVLGKTFVELGINPDEEVREKIYKSINEVGSVHNQEIVLLSKSGEKNYYEANIEKVFIDGEEFLLNTAQNITKYKRAEKELKNSEARYKAIFEATGTATIIVEDDTTILMANKECLNITGYDSAELIGMKWTSYVAQESLQEMLKNNQLRSQNPELALRKYEVKLLNKKGEKRDAVLNINMIPGTKQRVVSMLDITERKQAVEELLKSKSSLEEYFENDISADYVVSVSGKIFSCNKTFLNLFGFENKSETEKFDITKLYKNPEDRKQIIRLVKKQGKVENHEVEFISKEGKNIYAIINAIGIFGKDDKLEKIRGYVVDISKQKNIERELHKSEEKFRLMFYNNPQPMWIFDLETLVFLEVNQAAVNHYGFSKDEFLSMTLKDIRPVEEIPDLLKEIEKARSDLNESGAWRHLKKNGEIIVVEITSHSVTFNDRKARHVLIKDITERKFFETELLKLSRVVEQSPASVIITDLDGNIEYVNPKATEITGYTKEELIGKNPRILSSGEKPKSEYQQLWNTISSANEWFGEFHNKKKNGELYWESASISPIINEKQEIINYVAIKENITEQKKFIEDLKIAKEKAEESDRLKSAFLANMSHEIRTPMNGILGFTELLLEPDLSSEQKEAYIEIVNQSGQRMLNTVNDIVEISKIESGIVSVNLKEVDVQLCLDELMYFFIPEATKKGLKLTLENEVPKAVSVISTDQNKLDSIFTNLIKNAIKYTQAGEIRFGCKVHENRLEFYVKDTGIGIPTERQQAIFERFIQADIADTRVFEGSGLGLAIAKSYVEMLGGKIWVESEEGIGSTFYFTLPYIAEPQEKGIVKNGIQAIEGGNMINPEFSGLKIIIAEDDETSGELILIHIRKFGKEIINVQNGREAVEACRDNPDIDLILMDIQMPEMNGYEATRQIRQFNTDVIIIALTAFALAGDRENALEAGCNDYIAKPIKKDELMGLIQKYFKK